MSNIQQGWQCPVCGKVYAPSVKECSNFHPAPLPTLPTLPFRPVVPPKPINPFQRRYPMESGSTSTPEMLKDITVWYLGKP